MSAGEGSLREIWAALSVLTRRLDELSGLIGRLPQAGGVPRAAGEPLDEASRSSLAGLVSLLAIGPGRPRDEVLLLALDRVIHRVGADCAAVFLLTPEGQLEAAAAHGFGESLARVQPGAGLVGRALVEREAIRGSRADHGRDLFLRDYALSQGLALPIPAFGLAPIGVLFAGRRRAAEFDMPALEALLLLADRLGECLRMPAAPPEPRAPGFGTELDLARTASAVVREAAAALGAPVVTLLLPAAEGWVVGAGVGLPPGAAPLEGLMPAILTTLRTREPWTPTQGGTDDTLDRALGAPLQLILPILADDQVVALLAAGGPDRVAAPALAPLLPQASVAIRNARLHAETVAALAELQAGTRGVPVDAPPPARDFATLLAVVLGRLAAVRERVSDAAITRELEVAEEAAWRAAEAVRGLLGFAPGQRAVALTPLDLADVIRATAEQTQSRWRTGGATSPSLRVDLAAMPPVRGSADDLREALDHLLENAREATPEDSPITVRAQWDGGMRVEIVVEDRGVGMDDAVRARALEPFFSTKGPGRLGLGLPVTQAIVARHHGELEILSAPGLGTTVRVTLPTVAGSRQPVARRGTGRA